MFKPVEGSVRFPDLENEIGHFWNECGIYEKSLDARADAESFPGFDFDTNKGYPCPRHQMAIQAYGPTSIHRRSWAFMDNMAWTGVPRVVPAVARTEVPGQGTLI